MRRIEAPQSFFTPLFDVDPKGANGVLPLGQDELIEQLLAKVGLHPRMLGGIHEDCVVLIEEAHHTKATELWHAPHREPGRMTPTPKVEPAANEKMGPVSVND